VKPLPYLHLMPRVHEDFRQCLHFVAQHPWGRPSDRAMDIVLGIEKALSGPELNRVRSRRPSPGVELRRCNAAQFAIVYAYLRPTTEFPHGVVSIRAIRHSRARDVFLGVRESRAGYRAA
jgi:hypothetical protein